MATQTVSHADVPFSLITDSREGRLDLSLHGELDMASIGLLSQLAAEEQAGLLDVVVDITDLEFIDTAGVRALIDVRSRNESRGRTVALTNPTSLVRRVITLYGRADLLAV